MYIYICIYVGSVGRTAESMAVDRLFATLDREGSETIDWRWVRRLAQACTHNPSASNDIYTYTHIYIYTSAYIHMYVYVYIYIYIYTQRCIVVYTCNIYSYIYIYTCMYTYIYIYINVYVRMPARRYACS